MRNTLLTVLFIVLGGYLASLGYTVMTKQFWILIGLASAIQLVAIIGRK